MPPPGSVSMVTPMISVLVIQSKSIIFTFPCMVLLHGILTSINRVFAFL